MSKVTTTTVKWREIVDHYKEQEDKRKPAKDVIYRFSGGRVFYSDDKPYGSV